MSWMIYGANGYTGVLIAREAVRHGMQPIVAGRDAARIGMIADTLKVEGRVFSLDRPDLRGVSIVLHCAGPFAQTSRPMVDACLAAGAHYLDITGEIEVFESIFARDEEARRRNVALIPGVGFDVVPTDCLAAMLARKLPNASELLLAFAPGRGSSMSRGTLRTAIAGAAKGGAVRVNGSIVRVPVGRDVRTIPFRSGARTAMAIPWGDVSTAYRTTRIPNIRVYTASSPGAIQRARRLGALAKIPGVTALLQHLVKRGGPSDAQRASGRVDLWGEVSRGAEKVSMTMTTPDGYELTVRTALAAVERLLDGRQLSGALTPSQAFGAEFATEIEGVEM